MTTAAPSELTFRLDPTNPGQFFACCGLLELANRLWSGNATAAFTNQSRSFTIRVQEIEDDQLTSQLTAQILSCPIDNTMTPDERRRLDELSAMNKKQIDAAEREEEKKALDSLWRESPVVLGHPFNLTIDWHQDDRSGGSTFKTWAGQQSIIDIARGMQALLATTARADGELERLLGLSSRGGGLPFNFDSDLGGQGSALDVGFSFDPLPYMKIGVRPAIELCAFVGLQRFRPARVGRENRYRYSTWSEFLPTSIGSAAASGLLDSAIEQTFEFRLLYRTKYLKSFLSAKPIRGDV